MTVPGNAHLTLAQLAASTSSEPLPAGAAAHLHACVACQARSRDVVADGVRFLLTRCQPPPGLMDRVFDAIDTKPAPTPNGRLADGGHTRWPALRGRYGAKRVALAAAALAVLSGAAAAGLVTALSPVRTGPAAEGGSNAIAHAGVSLTECPRVQLQVLGRTLVQVSGTDLELEGPGSTPLTVTTSAATEILYEVTGTAADITDGAHVLVTGTTAGTAIAGLVVDVMPGTGSAVPSPRGESRAGATSGLAYGTVEDARGTGFTVVEGDGTRIPVTTSASTYVITAVRSSLGALQAGQGTSVVASAGPGGALTAITVEQGSFPPAALQALRESLKESGPQPAFPGSPGPSGQLQRNSPKGLMAGRLPSLLGGAGSPFASLGCDASAITGVNLLAIALVSG